MGITEKGEDMTQEARTLHYFQTHKRGLTPLDFWQKLGIYRASDVVYKLRKEGHDIRTDWIYVHNKYGDACRVAYYTYED